MNKTSTLRTMAALAAMLCVSGALAALGAHGPNGEHLDAPAAGPAASTAPRIEARTEAFELVGQLQGGEFSIFINRFDTNEPVLDAMVDVESGNHRAKAQFHADHGGYAIADEAFLKVIGRPGSHPLVITVTAGNDADLLEGSLRVAAQAHQDDHDRGGFGWRQWVLAAFAALLAWPVAWRIRRIWRRRRNAAPSTEVTR